MSGVTARDRATQHLTDDDEAMKYERKVHELGTGNSLQHNIPRHLVRKLGIEPGDTVEIIEGDDCYTVRRKDE